MPGHLPMLARSLPFYLLGFRYPKVFIDDNRPPRGSIAAFALVTAAVAWSGISAVLADALLDLAGLGVGMALAKQLPKRLPTLVGPLGWVGRRTLPIYVLHFPIIAAVGVATVRLLGPLPMNHPLVLVYAPALAAGAVAASLLLHSVLQRIGGGWMFALGGKRRIYHEEPTL
jgi:peptidoglycan/LPS O-acetylase OafA/YrhL